MSSGWNLIRFDFFDSGDSKGYGDNTVVARPQPEAARDRGYFPEQKMTVTNCHQLKYRISPQAFAAAFVYVPSYPVCIPVYTGKKAD